MSSLRQRDWDDLLSFARQVGFSEEPITVLKKRQGNNSVRPGSPYILLVGRPGAGIEIMLARWLNSELAERLKNDRNQIVVLGPTPTVVRPRLASWSTWSLPQWELGHLIVLRCTDKLP